MASPILASTFFLTLLLLVGLVFFVRASIKDRTQEWVLASEVEGEQLVRQLRQYFTRRAYRVIKVAAQSPLAEPTASEDLWQQPGAVTWAGQVRPSLFLAFFLSGLAGSGLFCLGLVFSILDPLRASLWPALAVLGPVAGAFYWQGAGREEQVCLRVEEVSEDPQLSRIRVRAHRDELAELQSALNLKPAEP